MKGAPTVASISTGGDVKSASGNVKGRSPVVSDCFVSTGTGFKSSPSSRGGGAWLQSRARNDSFCRGGTICIFIFPFGLLDPYGVFTLIFTLWSIVISPPT